MFSIPLHRKTQINKTMKNLFLKLFTISAMFTFISCDVEEYGIEAEENISEEKDLSAGGYVNFAESTVLNSFWMREDHEPWNRGSAEVYAHIIGLDSNKQPIISTVNMSYANHDGTVYYPNQKLIDWDANNYAGGLVSIVFMEADDAGLNPAPIFTTSYSEDRFLNTSIPLAVSIVTNDFLGQEGIGYATEENGIIYEGADDLLDVFYNISITKDYIVVGGAVPGSMDNVYVNLRRKFD